jgi:hypothetical protein
MISTPLRVYRTSGANPKTTGRCFGDYTDIEKMKDSARYAKTVEWSQDDHRYAGSAPGLLYGGTHGDDAKAVFGQLCQIVEEAIDLYRKEGKPLPTGTSSRDFANKRLTVELIVSLFSMPAAVPTW